MRSTTFPKCIFCILIITCCFFSGYSQAVKKHDTIVKINGDELNGNVIEISDSTIRFSYAGETLIYTIKKSDIQKITFASGRVENFATPSLPDNSVPQLSKEDHHNKVAILPFSYVQNGQNAAPELSEEVQNECYDLLSKHSGVYIVMSPRGTNVQLNKAGITKANMMNYTMGEICNILGVEYIVDGMVTQNRTSQSSYGSNTYSDKSKDSDKSDTKKSSGYGSTSSTSVQNYATVMDMKIYNDKSEVVYNQNRKAFWNTEDAYKNTMEYLLKRSPLYKK
jgi:hypothetical protein